MKKKFDLEIEFKGHKLYVDGYIENGQVKLYHVYLYKTDIEISDSLTADQHEELCDLIIETIK